MSDKRWDEERAWEREKDKSDAFLSKKWVNSWEEQEEKGRKENAHKLDVKQKLFNVIWRIIPREMYRSTIYGKAERLILMHIHAVTIRNPLFCVWEIISGMWWHGTDIRKKCRNREALLGPFSKPRPENWWSSHKPRATFAYFSLRPLRVNSRKKEKTFSHSSTYRGQRLICMVTYFTSINMTHCTLCTFVYIFEGRVFV